MCVHLCAQVAGECAMSGCEGPGTAGVVGALGGKPGSAKVVYWLPVIAGELN